MSIIIRLQNLPLSAKSADVRHFFGGLRIPSGGVHILGGEKGDAFIAFNSDEDARLAMRKDGGKIKDSRVRLYLSSYMEMQYEVDKITKAGGILSLSPRQSLERRYSRSRSPDIIYDRHKDRRGPSSSKRAMSRSPIRRGSRSRSPKRRSRRSVSPNPFLQRGRSKSPRSLNYHHGHHETDVNINSPFEFNSNANVGPSTSELEARLERRITEALEKNSVFAMSEVQNPPTFIPGLDIAYEKEFLPPPPVPMLYPPQNIPTGQVQNMQFSPISPFWDNNVTQFPPPGIPPLFPVNPIGFPNAVIGMPPTRNCFYVTISGLDPFWTYQEIQMMFREVYIPEMNIRWEVDNAKLRTGTAFIKLTNRNDFEKILANTTIFFNNRRITVSECPDFISCNYFQDGPDNRNEHSFNQKKDLCYMLKGLPFSCNIDDIANFFQGLELTDTVIFYNRDGKATGVGYVSFANPRDFEEAFRRNGEKIGHRYIQMVPKTDRDMVEAKFNNPSARSFTTYSKLLEERNLPASRRPLCVLMTGLPFHTSMKKLQAFFDSSDLKPDAIHMTLNKKKQSDGRAFIEFINFRDFDEAIKLHGTTWMDSMICLKQILYGEMIKILDTQKAKHHFEAPLHIGSQLNVPEKLPYVWEPPDVYEDHNIVNMQPVQDRISYSPKNNRIRPNLKQVTVQDTSNMPKFIKPSPPAPPPVKKYEPFAKKAKFINQKRQNVAHDKEKRNNKFNKNNIKVPSAEDNRQPIKFNVNKQLAITKANDTFDPSKNEEKFKLSKLSPDKETLKPPHPKKFQNSAPPKNLNVKKKTAHIMPKMKSPIRKQKPLRVERDFADDSFFKDKLKNDSFSSNLRNRESRPLFDRKIDPYEEDYHRGPPSPLHVERFPSPPRASHFKRFPSPSRAPECIVQMSNVSLAVNTHDLLGFLDGYAFDPSSITRRYTSEGEPTCDVRVAFINRKEAELVIRTLNGRRLKDMRVNMFIT